MFHLDFSSTFLKLTCCNDIGKLFSCCTEKMPLLHLCSCATPVVCFLKGALLLQDRERQHTNGLTAKVDAVYIYCTCAREPLRSRLV